MNFSASPTPTIQGKCAFGLVVLLIMQNNLGRIMICRRRLLPGASPWRLPYVAVPTEYRAVAGGWTAGDAHKLRSRKGANSLCSSVQQKGHLVGRRKKNAVKWPPGGIWTEGKPDRTEDGKKERKAFSFFSSSWHSLKWKSREINHEILCGALISFEPLISAGFVFVSRRV